MKVTQARVDRQDYCQACAAPLLPCQTSLPNTVAATLAVRIVPVNKGTLRGSGSTRLGIGLGIGQYHWSKSQGVDQTCDTESGRDDGYAIPMSKLGENRALNGQRRVLRVHGSTSWLLTRMGPYIRVLLYDRMPETVTCLSQRWCSFCAA